MVSFNKHLQPHDFININNDNFPIAMKFDNPLLFDNFNKYFKLTFTSITYDYVQL